MRNYLSLIKFSHTVFALPFAMIGFVLAYLKYLPEDIVFTLLLVLLCMVLARSAAMAFNRYLDRDIDAKNPRTAVREIPAGVISPRSALLFTIVNCLAFVICTYFINTLCFLLSPVALLVILGYSYTKRFTFLCHFVLGLGLGLAPVGAYLAISGVFHLLPVMIGMSVLLWVAGFDIIYALQDEEFDKSHGLYSIPAFLGKQKGLALSRVLHLICGICMLWVIASLPDAGYDTNWLSWVGLAVFISLLVYQHSVVKHNDLTKVNLAFFTANGIASVLFGSILLLDLLLI